MDSRSDPNAKRTMEMGTLTARPEDVVIGDKGGAVEEEVDIVKMQTVTAGQMFRFSDTKDKFTMLLGTIGAIIHVAGAIVVVAAYLQMACWQISAYNQCQRIRNILLKAILRQDIGWFDVHEVGELNTRLADDVTQIETGIGDKLSIAMQHVSTFVAGFVIAFVYGWELALVILAIVPLMAVVGAIANKMGTSWAKREQQAYAKAGAVAEEVIGSIRTVVAFGGQEKESIRYADNLIEARNMGFKKGLVNSIGISCIYLILFSSYALAFWYGTDLVSKDTISAGNLLTVFFSIMMGGFSIGNAMPNLQDFANARGAAYAIYNIIDLVPSIDSSSTEGDKPSDIKGNVEFKDVHFEYPARKNTPVLKGLNLKASVGQTVALVGSSGCGKSTTIQLLQRFYDPKSGQVLIDGKDISTFNVKWLRQHIGVVSQEPVLFGASIAQNIRFGRDGVSMGEMVEAAKMSNAHDFICQLPQKYETVIGERGTQLSGGQKQRIAIARALVSDPRILLLDEATSALDNESEASVQEALDRARMGRTTFVVAHRLSTVRNADVIFGFRDGVAVENGSHADLMQNESGVYYQLVTNQTKDAKPEDEASEPELRRIMRMNAPEWKIIVVGCFAALVAGGIQPASAVLYTQILSIFEELDPQKMRDEGTKLALMYLGIGAVSALASVTLQISFSQSGTRLTMRLRKLAFDSIIRQDMSFFDDLSNSTGALGTRLASDAALVQGATGSRLAIVIQSLSSVGVGILIGMIYSWKLSLLVVAFMPFIMMSGAISVKRATGNSKAGKRNPLEESGKVAVEAIGNIRTVASLTKEEYFIEAYQQLTAAPYVKKRQSAHLQGLGFGLSFSILFFCYAATYTLGAYLITEGELEYQDMFRVVASMIFGAQGAGQAASFGMDYSKARAAAARLFALYDLQPLVDCSPSEGKKLDSVEGSMELSKVCFNYPTRPNVAVLRGLSFSVKPGNTVALVGSSGCGKSTVVQLIERFYDPLSGTLSMDNQGIKGLNLPWMRSQISLVSQEPMLFDCSIRENIAYGDNSRTVSMDDIIAAARDANIHNFIQSLPEGYDTNVGDKGTQLSGGQKQRVAIARALVRNPKILLLDEATSALDTESEKVVQQALDQAQQGRTSIVIAHRLSTIQNADCIIVINNGRVAEVGTHSQLMELQGLYYNLNTTQKGDKKQS
ncbi:hypothetical protein CAPTEDRAFT_209638 [Capitella teleta]|uniref:Bile salt export pump n=1 Tax=Capitella teleta TaxID=283909 RepID=R7VFY3_CAPTE|nr:hypothetical protein CAPTEDRAFT_209638 [Capitella teleta]|eukprot:ELU17748.1 hypothetical protein CAPTEDRAFT_209638 [Capitella teleta]